MKKIFALLISILVTSGCTTTEYIKVSVPACDAFSPIYYDRNHDTLETIKQVKVHNAVYDECKLQQALKRGEVVND